MLGGRLVVLFYSISTFFESFNTIQFSKDIVFAYKQLNVKC